MQQPPLDDSFERVACVGVVHEISEDVITSLPLFSDWIASHCFFELVYAFSVQ
jgi:hypothetical protein